jgi:hypothetical protein
MKPLGMVLARVLVAATLLSGCVVVPLGGWYGYGYGHGHGGGGYHHYGPYPYRGR